MSGSVVESRRRRIAAVLLVVTAAGVLVILLWPTPVDGGGMRPIMRELVEFLRGLRIPWRVGYAIVESTANAIMFLPLGLLLAYVLPTWWPRPVLVSATTLVLMGGSAVGELLQALLLPERTPSERDVVANGVGALIGALLAVLLQLAAARRVSARRDARAQMPANRVPA